MKHGIIKKDKMYLVKKVYVGWDLVPANSKKEAKEKINGIHWVPLGSFKNKKDAYDYIQVLRDEQKALR